MKAYNLDLFDTHKDLVQHSIEVIKMYDPKDSVYYFGDSGGKDSEVLRHLLIRSGVDYEAVHNVTGLGKPEQMRHIKENHPETKFSFPKKKIRELVIKNVYPPTRVARYCCEYLKETGGQGRIKIMGIRAAESNPRKKNRKEVEHCNQDHSRTINPLYYWNENDIWRYIDENNLEYCSLYDKGYNRVGCIFCPFKPNRIRQQEAKDYPKFKERMIRIFDAMLEERRERELDTSWENGEEVFEWWIYEK